MGGKAFVSGPDPLRTPRMPPSTYYKVRDHCLSTISAIYDHVATPIEAPAKSSYGDIDFIVSQPDIRSLAPISDTLTTLLNTKRAISTTGSAATFFAIPYPGIPNTFVQVDVQECLPCNFHWQVFHQSHGDLWNLLGTTIRPFGFTANDIGLHLRIAEIEESNKKRSLLFLTNDPDAVLNLFGRDREAYRHPFDSVEAMYQYVVGCRFFKEETYEKDELKANDRKRTAQRDLYRKFVHEWLPKNGIWSRPRTAQESTLSRTEVAEMVLDRFEKRESHRKVVEEWRRVRADLLHKQRCRQKRKADTSELDRYADAWIKWLKRDS